MYIHTSYDREFVDLFMHLKSKYGQKLFDLEGIGKQLDMSKFSKDFFSAATTADASIDANANVSSVSAIAYHVEMPKPFFKLNSYFMLWKYMKRLYGAEAAEAIIEHQLIGDIYTHDFTGIGGGLSYCYNYSAYDILLLGLPMVDKIKSAPPKHLYSFKSQIEQFISIASNSTLGAAGLADLFIVMSYYVKNILDTRKDAGFTLASEEDCFNYVRENIVSLVYTLNQPFRAGLQSPFTNVSIFDRVFLESLCPNYIFPDGTTPDIPLVQKIQDIYLDVMNREMERTPVTFPVTTSCMATDSDNNIIDQEFVNYIAEKNLKYGFINMYVGKSSTLSSCCRLRSDTDNEYFNSFGSGSTKIGSLGVCTINLAKLGFKYKDDSEGEARLLNNVGYLVGVAARVNQAKRKIVKAKIDTGKHPLYSLGFIDINKQYSTVGVNGLNECCELMGYDICSEAGQEFAMKIISCINEENDKYQKQYKVPFNAEMVPSEGSAIKLAEKDKLLNFNDGRYDIYSNQFIPLTVNADLLDRINIQGKFDKEFSGGAICHINVEERIDDPSKVASLINFAAKKGVIYFSINYLLQECEEGHMVVGGGERCSVCGGIIVNRFTRVVGFLSAVKSWSKTRREKDFPNRVWYANLKS